MFRTGIKKFINKDTNIYNIIENNENNENNELMLLIKDFTPVQI